MLNGYFEQQMMAGVNRFVEPKTTSDGKKLLFYSNALFSDVFGTGYKNETLSFRDEMKKHGYSLLISMKKLMPMLTTMIVAGIIFAPQLGLFTGLAFLASPIALGVIALGMIVILATLKNKVDIIQSYNQTNKERKTAVLQ